MHASLIMFTSDPTISEPIGIPSSTIYLVGHLGPNMETSTSVWFVSNIWDFMIERKDEFASERKSIICQTIATSPISGIFFDERTYRIQ